MTDAAAGSDFDRVGRAENTFESWARSLCEFVIRATILPITLFFTKPSTLLEATRSGNYRPLPSPFLLALITALVVSGVVSNITHFQISDAGTGLSEDSQFLQRVVSFYTNLNGANTILYSLPYVFGLWALSGLISALMLRGIQTAEALMTVLSFCLSALVELTIILAGVSLVFQLNQDLLIAALSMGLAIYSVIVAIKLIRLILLVRKEHGSPLAGAIIACIPAFLLITLVGLIGSSLTYAVYSERTYILQAAEMRAQAQRDAARTAAFDAWSAGSSRLEQRDFAGAIDGYTRAIDLIGGVMDQANPVTGPNADDVSFQGALYNERCWARAVWGQQLDVALADCNTSLQLLPDTPETLDSRGLVKLRSGDYEGAFQDYNAAVTLDASHAHALYGRGLARLRLGQTQQGMADIGAAMEANGAIRDMYQRYGVNDDGTSVVQRSVLPRAEPGAISARSPN